MFVYWGGQTGAKKFVKELMIYNNKDYVEHYPFHIVHAKHICHSAPKPLRYDSQWDVSRKADIIFRKKETPNQYTVKTTGWERDTDFVNMGLETMNPSHRTLGGFSPRMENRYFYRDRFKIKNKSKDLVELSVNEIPECHTIFPYHRLAMYSFDGVKISDWFRSHTNIVPYKSDLVESAINQLDNWGEFYSADADPWWKVHKKQVWDYLDLTVFFTPQKVEERLREAGIAYEYFDLDKDDWAKTFSVQKNLPRQITHHVYCQMNRLEKDKKKKAYENYRRMTEVAKEYVITKGKKDNRL